MESETGAAKPWRLKVKFLWQNVLKCREFLEMMCVGFCLKAYLLLSLFSVCVCVCVSVG